jgi:hypothetical protein
MRAAKVLVCRCEDVTLDEVEEAIAKGHRDLESVKRYTGFGTGLKALNVQAMFNGFQWGQDNRIHVQSGSGNRGKIKCLLRPDLPEIKTAEAQLNGFPRAPSWRRFPSRREVGIVVHFLGAVI